MQGLTEDSGLSVGGEGIEERLAVCGVHSEISSNSRFERGAFFIGDGILKEAGFFSPVVLIINS